MASRCFTLIHSPATILLPGNTECREKSEALPTLHAGETCPKGTMPKGDDAPCGDGFSVRNPRDAEDIPPPIQTAMPHGRRHCGCPDDSVYPSGAMGKGRKVRCMVYILFKISLATAELGFSGSISINFFKYSFALTASSARRSIPN